MQRVSLSVPRPNHVLSVYFLALMACSPEVLTTAETDQVLSIQSREQDYAALRTYLLPEEIVDLCEWYREGGDTPQGGSSSGLEDCIEVEHQWDEVAIEAIRGNMNHLGYREAAPSDEEAPDIVFAMGWVARDNWYVSNSYPYCFPSEFYYEGCWYASRGSASSLPTGALLVDMMVTDESQAGDFKSAWTLAFQGHLSKSNEVSTSRRIERAINQGFSQSPYLSEGGFH